MIETKIRAHKTPQCSGPFDNVLIKTILRRLKPCRDNAREMICSAIFVTQSERQDMKLECQSPAGMVPCSHERRSILTALPPHNGTRWTTRRKVQVVVAVLGGVLSLDEACARYALSLEEFLGWQRLVGQSARFKHSPATGAVEAQPR
jgi:hypothetical protein